MRITFQRLDCVLTCVATRQADVRDSRGAYGADLLYRLMIGTITEAAWLIEHHCRGELAQQTQRRGLT